MADEGFFDPQEFIRRVGIRQDMLVADFGSGSGDIALLIAKLVGEKGAVTALDVMPGAIESVQAKAKSAGLENILAIRANLEVLRGSTLKDDSQDVVFLANILWQSSKKKEILEEAFRITKSGGGAACIEWTDKAGTMGPPAGMKMGQDELAQLLKAAGFEAPRAFAAGAFHYGMFAKKP